MVPSVLRWGPSSDTNDDYPQKSHQVDIEVVLNRPGRESFACSVSCMVRLSALFLVAVVAVLAYLVSETRKPPRSLLPGEIVAAGAKVKKKKFQINGKHDFDHILGISHH
jgi:hypothetical protein